MSGDDRRQALPPIGRRPVMLARDTPAAPDGVSEHRTPASASTRLLVGAHLLLLIQSALIMFSRIELGAARGGIAAITAVSAVALVWAVALHLRRFSGTSRRHPNDA